ACIAPPAAFRNYPTLLSASIPELRTISRHLHTLRHVPMQSDNSLYRRWSLPGNRRARSSFLAHSAAISSGLTILFPSGLFLLVVAFQVPGRLQAGART
ncbi:MAG: hypothetical protein WCP72_11335, partial [Desulfomonile sp.]